MKQSKMFWSFLFFFSVIVFSVFYIVKGLKMSTEHYKPHSYELKQLSNGLQILLVKDKRLPYISFEMLFNTGVRQNPADREGLLSLLVESMDKGTKKQSAVELAENIELLGSFFSSDLESDYTSFSMEALSWLHEPLLKIFAEIITQPTFSQEEFDRVKKQALGFAERSGEHFSAYSSRVFNKYLYESHPYGYYVNGRLKSLQDITREEVKDFYEKEFHPKRALLNVSGRYPEDIMERLEQVFKDWKPVTGQLEKQKDISLLPVPEVKKTQLLLVDHPAAVQAEIRMGHISVPRSHPDYLALRMANVILGGTFSSRLMGRVRVQRGLTYGISSYFSSKKELGAFKIGLAVRNNRVGDALLEIQGVLEEFYEKGITEEEFKKSQQLLKSQFISGTASPENFAHYLMYLNNQGIPYSYVEEYFDNMNKLDIHIINAVIKKHLKPDKIKILVLSKAKEVEFQLQDYQPLQIKSYKEYL